MSAPLKLTNKDVTEALLKEARRRLRQLARAVVEMRRCHKSPSGPCAIITQDDHVRDVYRVADQAIHYLDQPDGRPS